MLGRWRRLRVALRSLALVLQSCEPLKVLRNEQRGEMSSSELGSCLALDPLLMWPWEDCPPGPGLAHLQVSS